MRVSGSAGGLIISRERARTCGVCTCVHKIIRSFNDYCEEIAAERESRETCLKWKYMKDERKEIKLCPSVQ